MPSSNDTSVKDITILAMLRRFSAVWSRELSKEMIEAYRQALKDVTGAEILQATDDCLATCKTFPVPSEVLKRVPKKEKPKAKSQYHWAPHEFDRDYMRQLELKDQDQIRRVTQDEVKQIIATHGQPDTASELVGPPKDFGAQVAELSRRSTERRAVMEGLILKEQTTPPPGEVMEPTNPWAKIELTPTEIVLQSNRAEIMRAALMRTAHERKEITDEEFDDFRKTGMLPAKCYKLPEDR